EGAPLAQSSEQVEITITSTGDYLVNGEKLAASDSQTLRTALLKLGQEKTDLPLQIYADANVAYQSVVRVYDVAGQLGFVKLSLTTRESPNEAQ
ncbi:MAG: biopolymer transporter ExbD, partial [Pseudomonadota bacterium]|nr:biopolymer transporter ExbD [Pseudomonadota bacterium]